MGDSPLEDEEVAGPSRKAGAGPGSARSGSSRPSFTDYWRRTKEAAKHITFVSSNLEQSGGPSKDDQRNQRQQPDGGSNSQTKSQARRAQVRKAQIQHRQRKANYTKELEMDVAKLRDVIEQAERDALLLRNENEAIRRRLLSRNALPAAMSMSSVTSGPGYSTVQISAPEYTVSLLSSTNLVGTPTYQVQRASSSSSWSLQSGFSTVQASPETGGFTGGVPSPGSGATLSEAHTDHAINFILGLEHICWDHFHPSHYDHQDFDPENSETGHTLMVSSIALRSASASTWDQIGSAKDRMQQLSSAPNPPPQPIATPSASSSSFANLNPNPNPTPHTHSHSHSHNNNNNNNTHTLATWRTPPTSTDATAGLTLESLYGLASTLNPPDRELAPVQAWFEIARVYGRAAVRDTAAMDRVCAELAPAVECLVFGAVIQRGAFEDVVARVLGPAPMVGAGGPVIGVAA